MNEQQRRDWFLQFARSLNQYDTLRAQELAYIMCLDPADYPRNKQQAAWMVAGSEIRRIYHGAKRYG